MATGIYKRSITGGHEEVPQKHIDYWCDLCRFPGRSGCGGDQSAVQRCWDEGGAVAGKWHLLHECPFKQRGESCRCNEFATIEEVFASLA